MIICCLCPTREYFASLELDVTIAGEDCIKMVFKKRERDLYRATSAVTQDLGICGFIQRCGLVTRSRARQRGKVFNGTLK